ncbi:MAG: chaperone modulatory protein CbpM [Rhodospirillaceae bacterium]|jgi:chaperone modulatory protein CbpM|nr:chaperone modulatory protein CbpM [Rhodospirillaceae bacterium]
MDGQEFLTRTRLDADALQVWIEAGWLVPPRNTAGSRFSEIDLARAELIRDLREDLGVNDDGVTVVLELLDQIHGLRRMLGDLLSALATQPRSIRRDLAIEIRQRAGLGRGDEVPPAEGNFGTPDRDARE